MIVSVFIPLEGFNAIFFLYSRLAPLNLLARRSPSEFGDTDRGMGYRCLRAEIEAEAEAEAEKEDDGTAGVGILGIQGRLRGRSPLSCRMATRVAHPLVFTSCRPSVGSWAVATRHSSFSSSC